MPYVVPSMPLVVNIWRNRSAGGVYAAPDVITVGNLSPGKRVFGSFALQTTGGQTQPLVMELLLPKKTDIRAHWNSSLPDTVECPGGSARFYDVVWVDDIGKGFANEHRIAMLVFCTNNAISSPFSMPVPIPLP